MTDDKLEEFIKLAAETGRVFVAQDIYDDLRTLPVSYSAWKLLGRLEVVVYPLLPPGGMMAVNFQEFDKYMMPVIKCQ